MASSSPPHVVEDLPPFLQLLSDGTVIRDRSAEYSILPTPPPPGRQPDVRWKDVVYDAARGLKLRVYKPPLSPSSSGNNKKLPVLVYFHGGGYVICSFDLPNFHSCCLRLAGELPALVFSADYRLAPEHRLPAAFHDAASVLSWVRAQATATGTENADPWLADSADFSRVFVSGDSAGGGIVNQVALRLGSGQLDLGPLRVAGHVMLFPLFGGEQRTASEAEYPPGPHLSLPVLDKGWRLALPVGATRDHPLANPLGPGSPALELVAGALPPLLVVVGGLDLLRDRAVDYAARLEAMGHAVELVEFEGQHHGFFAVEPYGEAGHELVCLVKRFVHGNGAAVSS
ncbi:probable carboxylesterase 15 isoform X2 [Brachypodium distachyon]|uniref:probable carboxylesterase 15 isoform X2 n=1 Tax=Brachypodium distachyon TaxID=15368 RepID=UPI00052FE77F|nr:probable carboxylesterase 15 isoform X2 [Brachypodium distachyon]|eukprot:XP_024317267.1 probable carboxylesterase 15 isoform X2 [Brachypodium distachyon]